MYKFHHIYNWDSILCEVFGRSDEVDFNVTSDGVDIYLENRLVIQIYISTVI